MHSLRANWLNEMEKLWVRRRTKGFLLLTILIPVLSGLGLSQLQSHTGIAAGLGSDLPMLMLGLFTTLFLPLFLFMTVVDSFTGEAAARTFKLVLVRPIARSKVFASKVLALAVYTAIHLGIVWLISVLVQLFLNRSGWFNGMAESALAYTAAWVPMIAVALVAVLIAQGFNNSAGALGLIMVIYISAKLLPFLIPTAAVWSVFSYTDWHTLWIGGGASAGKLFNTFAILLSYIMMAYMGSLMIFERKQF
jgi:ABC-2 type transport system permease protein